MSLDLRQLIQRHQGQQLSLLSEYINPQMAKVLKILGFDPVYVRGQGAHLWDDRGNDYLDMLSGFGVFAVGRSHPKVKEAIRQYLDLDTPNLVKMGTQLLAGLLARRLVDEFAPPGLDTVFFCNSGAEAVDGALKFAHAFTQRRKFLYCDHGYHGLTLGTLAINGCREFRSDYEAILSGGTEIPFGDTARLEAELSRGDVAALVLEPVIGHGVFIPPDAFLPQARELCTRHGTLLVADEVQTGFGRTGKMFACEHWNVIPDILCLGKAIGGGVMPLSAFMSNKTIWKVLEEHPFIHTSTFGGNPLACIAGIATINVLLSEDLPRQAAEKGDYFLKGLREIQQRYPKHFVDVHGKGLLIGMDFVTPEFGYEVAAGLFTRGVLVAGTLIGIKTIRIEPALTIGYDLIDKVLDRLDDTLGALVHRKKRSQTKKAVTGDQ